MTIHLPRHSSKNIKPKTMVEEKTSVAGSEQEAERRRSTAAQALYQIDRQLSFLKLQYAKHKHQAVFRENIIKCLMRVKEQRKSFREYAKRTERDLYILKSSSGNMIWARCLRTSTKPNGSPKNQAQPPKRVVNQKTKIVFKNYPVAQWKRLVTIEYECVNAYHDILFYIC